MLRNRIKTIPVYLALGLCFTAVRPSVQVFAETENSAEAAAGDASLQAGQGHEEQQGGNKTDADNAGEEDISESQENSTDAVSSDAPSENAADTPTLTQEQIDKGYTIKDGKILTPEESSLDSIASGDEDEVQYGGVTPGDRTGYVRFEAITPSDIHGEEVYIEVMNMDTTDIYGATMYEINGYGTSICLPAGRYCFCGGGYSKDTAGRYTIDNQYFKVKTGSNMIIRFTIHDAEAEKKAAEEKAAEADTESTGASAAETTISEENGAVLPDSGNAETVSGNIQNQTSAQKETDNKEDVWKEILGVILSIGIPAGIAAYLVIKNRKNTRGFED